ncbi:angiogenic factor with G patch and FHA domains 1 [Trichonephila inaurata madagascariensis]|uniref:Angiogenic factor with G patch and FHA domains 1 n=1 Tax=Trichonephila inaurata madagascariensis TaxID=2747483 RepID=A0A8X7CFH7_9ARAC|nr:angiogenic factor with G patch and FHA domains 1 [Trichonephila inaurata madagascariensis]
MADDVMSCEGCQSLKILLHKKDEEIKRLNLKIQNLTISLQQFQNQTECDSNCCSSYDTSDADACKEKSKVDTNNSADIGSDTSKEWHFQKNEDSQIINEEEEDNFSPCKKADIETNDLNTEQFYVPQTGSYYKYDYSKHKYELVKNTKETCDSNLTHTCESVVDKVDNLKINDEEISSSNKSEEVNDVNSTVGRTCFTININVTSGVCGQNSDSVEDQKEKVEDETVKNSAADWQPPEGSNTTVKDLVTEVAEQSIGMSDFIYDEKSSMYYCKSNGYYYDPIKKLLYDPRSRIYYLYIQETLSYEFYCKADSNSNTPNNTSSIDCTNSEKKCGKDKARKKFWKKKQRNRKKHKYQSYGRLDRKGLWRRRGKAWIGSNHVAVPKKLVNTCCFATAYDILLENVQLLDFENQKDFEGTKDKDIEFRKEKEELRKKTENETRIREARNKEEEQARFKAEVEARLKSEEENKAVEEAEDGRRKKNEQKNSFERRDEIEERKMACGRADITCSRGT